MIARLLQMGFPGVSCRKLAGFLGFELAEAAVLIGVGHWLHDTPPIFQIGQCVFSESVPMSETGRQPFAAYRYYQGQNRARLVSDEN
jgi:hypothetical protein